MVPGGLVFLPDEMLSMFEGTVAAVDLGTSANRPRITLALTWLRFDAGVQWRSTSQQDLWRSAPTTGGRQVPLTTAGLP
jgi:hypothetical protein